MPTNTDTMWTNRLDAILTKADFIKNDSTTFTTAYNKVADNLMNMIGKTIINSVDNPYMPFGKYNKDMMDYGNVLQQYKVKYTVGTKYKPESQNSGELNPFLNKKENDIAQYNTMNDVTQYQATIQDSELQKAFNNAGTFGNFVSARLDALYQSDALDKYTKWKTYIGDSAKFTFAKGIDTVQYTGGTPTVAEEDKAYKMVKVFRKYANSKFRQPNDCYNAVGDMTISSDVDIIMKSDDKNIMDEILKGVYNLDKVDINANFIYVDDFPEWTVGVNTYEPDAFILDARKFGYYPRSVKTGSIYNPRALNTNYFTTVEGMYVDNTFQNGVAIRMEKV